MLLSSFDMNFLLLVLIYFSIKDPFVFYKFQFNFNSMNCSFIDLQYARVSNLNSKTDILNYINQIQELDQIK